MSAFSTAVVGLLTGVRSEDFTANDPGPGLTAFLIVGGLTVATALLLWSMLRQMRKVPRDLDVPLRGASKDAPTPTDPPGDPSTDR